MTVKKYIRNSIVLASGFLLGLVTSFFTFLGEDASLMIWAYQSGEGKKQVIAQDTKPSPSHPSKRSGKESEFDYSHPRYLEVVTKVSNGIRFDIYTRSHDVYDFHPNKDVEGDHYFRDYEDMILVVRRVGEREVLYANAFGYLGGATSAKFIESDDLSEQFVIVQEWTGGASCCYVHHVFTTAPEFKMLLERDTDSHVAEKPITGPDLFEIHSNEKPTYTSNSHVGYQYNPEVIDLHKLVEMAFSPDAENLAEKEERLKQESREVLFDMVREKIVGESTAEANDDQ